LYFSNSANRERVFTELTTPATKVLNDPRLKKPGELMRGVFGGGNAMVETLEGRTRSGA